MVVILTLIIFFIIFVHCDSFRLLDDMDPVDGLCRGVWVPFRPSHPQQDVPHAADSVRDGVLPRGRLPGDNMRSPVGIHRLSHR